jgi:hypothetical protein
MNRFRALFDRTATRNRTMKRMHPGTLAAVVLAVLALIYIGYSFVVTKRMDDRAATTTGGSTAPKDPGSIQDLPGTQKPKPPLQDSAVPPAAPQSR